VDGRSAERIAAEIGMLVATRERGAG
jgi:hypothetical protein